MESALPEAERENGVFEVQISARELVVSKNEVVRALGYQEGKIPEHFEEIIERILPQASKRYAIRAGYRILELRKPGNRSDGFYVGETFFAPQKIVAARMKKAERAACFVCTIGMQMETWAGQLSREGDIVMGHLVSTVATVAVENAVDTLHCHLGKKMQERGMRITNRYSPGYCGWPVSDQHALFSLFPTEFCGVTLTESALMKPVKSVSGVVGIGPEVAFAGYDCAACKVNDCIYRAFRAARNNGNAG